MRRRFNVIDVVWTSKRRRVLTGIDHPLIISFVYIISPIRLASIDILGRERELRIGKLDWHAGILIRDTKGIPLSRSKSRVREIVIVY